MAIIAMKLCPQLHTLPDMQMYRMLQLQDPPCILWILTPAWMQQFLCQLKTMFLTMKGCFLVIVSVPIYFYEVLYSF